MFQSDSRVLYPSILQLKYVFVYYTITRTALLIIVRFICHDDEYALSQAFPTLCAPETRITQRVSTPLSKWRYPGTSASRIQVRSVFRY